jgi:glutamate racemase
LTTIHKIGILATQGTLNSALFHQSIKQYQDVVFVEQIGHGLVELIENGQIDSPAMEALLHQYLRPMIAANIDYLVLGCSHYPYLIPQIQKILPPHITIIDSGEAVARQTQRVLEQSVGLRNPSKPSSQRFFTNMQPQVLEAILNHKYPVIPTDF